MIILPVMLIFQAVQIAQEGRDFKTIKYRTPVLFSEQPRYYKNYGSVNDGSVGSVTA